MSDLGSWAALSFPSSIFCRLVPIYSIILSQSSLCFIAYWAHPLMTDLGSEATKITVIDSFPWSNSIGAFDSSELLCEVAPA
ncbi:hypothetical protein Ddc_14178 [Ditylenchus destructor]|nr:hypothetical protein Ddc_14178 [Ditylenchus destructor]